MSGSKLDDLYSEAVKHTGVGYEGDYIDNQTLYYEPAQSVEDGNLHLHYTLQYYSTMEEEMEAEKEYAFFFYYYKLDGMSEYEKARAVYEYIIDMVSYNYDVYDEGLISVHYGEEVSHETLVPYTAYAAIILHKTLCNGYATLFYRLANGVGLDARVISGFAETYTGSDPHAWNIVRVDGEYYYLDSTWDNSFVTDGDYEYFFLLSEENFSDHDPNDGELDGYEISKTDYVKPENVTYESGDWTYRRSYGAIINGCTEQGKTLTTYHIPSVIDGIPVIAVEFSSGFDDFWQPNGVVKVIVEKLILPEGITCVRGVANVSCVKEVSLPSTMITDGDNAFGFADSRVLEKINLNEESPYLRMIDGVLYSGDGKVLLCCPHGYENSELIVPDGVETVGWCSVLGVESITKVVLPSSVETIGLCAFEYCSNLSEIEFSEGLKNIGYAAFGSTKIQRLDFPESIEYIGHGICHNNIEIAWYSIPKSNTSEYFTQDGVLFRDYDNTGYIWLMGYPVGISEAVEYTVPDFVNFVVDSSFQGAKFTRVICPDSVDTMGSYAFWGCENLTEVEVGSSFVSIDDNTFGGTNDCPRDEDGSQHLKYRQAG